MQIVSPIPKAKLNTPTENWNWGRRQLLAHYSWIQTKPRCGPISLLMALRGLSMISGVWGVTWKPTREHTIMFIISQAAKTFCLCPHALLICMFWKRISPILPYSPLPVLCAAEEVDYDPMVLPGKLLLGPRDRVVNPQLNGNKLEHYIHYKVSLNGNTLKSNLGINQKVKILWSEAPGIQTWHLLRANDLSKVDSVSVEAIWKHHYFKDNWLLYSDS